MKNISCLPTVDWTTDKENTQEATDEVQEDYGGYYMPKQMSVNAIKTSKERYEQNHNRSGNSKFSKLSF